MKTLWFRGCFIAPILSGHKADTIRHLGRRRFQIGETIALSNGPRPPFARARITAVEPVDADSIDPDRHSMLAEMTDCGKPLHRIAFDLVSKEAGEPAGHFSSAAQ